MAKLIIIGNGFDIHHNLKTSYSDFKCWLCKKYSKDFTKILYYAENNYLLEKLEGNWSNIENALSLNYDAIPSEDVLKVSNAFVVGFKNRFNEWIYSVDKEIKKIDSKNKIDFITNDNYYISFNYTRFLEKGYEISHGNIAYFHNMVYDDKEDLIGVGDMINHIVFGNKNNKLYFDNDTIQENFNRFFEKDTKSIFDNQYQRFIIKIKEEIDEIIVLGHSMDCENGDMDYFRKIVEFFPNTDWKISYYSKRDKSHKTCVVDCLKEKSNANIYLIQFKEMIKNEKG